MYSMKRGSFSDSKADGKEREYNGVKLSERSIG